MEERPAQVCGTVDDILAWLGLGILYIVSWLVVNTEMMLNVGNIKNYLHLIRD